MPRPSARPSLATDNPAHHGAAAVDRALSLLGAWRQGDGALGLAELAARTGLHKSTALRGLASLAHAGLLQRQSDGQYRPGPEIARLHAVYTTQFSLDQAVLPVLQALVQATGESAAYHVRQGQAPRQTRLCLFRVDSPHPIRDHIRAGDLLPLDRGAGGRVLSAFGLGNDTHRPNSEERQLYARIRSDGYFAAQGDRLDGVAGISAPVFDSQDRVVAALTLTLPEHRWQESHVEAVLHAARQLNGRV
jgi:DNA-binding IclR family transcriptional regulator